MHPVWIVLLCVLGVTVVLFVGAYVAMRLACRRGKDLHCNLDGEIHNASYERHRELILTAQAWLQTHPHEPVQTRSYDGLTLVGRYVPCENARATALLFHGWRSTPMIDFGAAFAFYHSLGLNLLLVDERGQNGSEGKYITFGIRERRDVASWVAWHNARFGDEMPLLLGGLSMGATVVLMASGDPMPANVKGVIADCGFTSPYEIVGKVARDMHVPARLLLPFVDCQTRLFAGFGLKEYSTLDAMKKTRLPVFFAHGEGDAFVPCEMTKQAYAACRSEDKTLLLVPDAGHGQSYLKQTEQYQNTVRAFLDRVLK